MILKSETLELREDNAVVRVRQRARALAIEIGLGLVDQTKIVTATSELARNTVDYGGGGTATLDVINEGNRRGLKLTFSDQGPGIENIDLALTDGYTTGGGLGLGLSGSRRLVNDFSIDSTPGIGTTVSITRWI
ncbi:anti-sigma regulatory factor [Desulforhopalus vacuolatus]|uniref:anti-sigma regulatory factor n=1 Tax=Desulforhopalus vacuolatus TaxID=40414 RepID=UPI001F06AC08|nr:anti-sigma regulatory factor [Desulforhopalus vacuolatus]